MGEFFFLFFVVRSPFATYLGMTFNSIKLSPWKLKVSINDIELLPSKSSMLQSIILSIFPSANVQRVENYIDYPESKITVQKISIKLRISSLAGPTRDGDPCTNYSSTHTHKSTFDNAVHRDLNEPINDKVLNRGLRMIHRLIPYPIVVVKLHDVSIEIEKTYLAPEPPTGFRQVSFANSQTLPTALPNRHNDGEGLPTFHQDSVLDIIKNEEVDEADKVTLFVERWSE